MRRVVAITPAKARQAGMRCRRRGGESGPSSRLALRRARQTDGVGTTSPEAGATSGANPFGSPSPSLAVFRVIASLGLRIATGPVLLVQRLVIGSIHAGPVSVMPTAMGGRVG